MGYIKLKDKVQNFDDYFIDKYGKDKFNQVDDYKFIKLLCEMLPDLEMSDGFPSFLLTDTWEVTYEVLSNFDIKNIKLIDKTIEFLEVLSNDTNIQWYLNDFFETIVGDIDKFNCFIPKFKTETKKIWVEYTKSCQ